MDIQIADVCGGSSDNGCGVFRVIITVVLLVVEVVVNMCFGFNRGD